MLARLIEKESRYKPSNQPSIEPRKPESDPIQLFNRDKRDKVQKYGLFNPLNQKQQSQIYEHKELTK